MTDELLKPVKWIGNAENGYVWMLDQRLLPHQEVGLELHTHGEVAKAISDMVIRGAPAIGLAAAMGVVMAAREAFRLGKDQHATYFSAALNTLAATRPTAVNLFWAIERMRECFERTQLQPFPSTLDLLLAEALAIQEEDAQACFRMGELGADLLPPNATILTHCNAGAIATAAHGTALGVVRSGFKRGLVKRVFVDETRPYLQGARLTTWELAHDGIPVTLITDSMAGYFMQQKEIDCVIVGSDRIAANGDVANKIGTYSVAVLAKAHNIPFFVVAPTTTIDLSTPSGQQIPVEERSADELTVIGGTRFAPEGIDVRYPAFDVTPAELVTAIVTERGVAQPPTKKTVAALFD